MSLQAEFNWALMKHPSIKWQVSLGLTILCVILVTLVSALQMRGMRADFVRVLSDQQFSLVTRVAEELDNKLENSKAFLTGNAEFFPPGLLNSPTKIREYLVMRPGLRSIFDDILVFAPDGGLIADFPELPARQKVNAGDRAFFQRVLATRKFALSEPLLSRTRKEPIVQMGAPIVDRQGNLVAIMVGVIRLYKTNFLGDLSNMRIGKTGYFALVTKGSNPVYIIHADKTRILQPQRRDGASHVLEGLEGSVESVSSLGVAGLYSGKPLKNAPWSLFAVEPLEEVFSPITAAENRLMKISIAVFLVIAPLIWLLSWRVLSPLSRLQKAIAQFKIGNNVFSPVPVTRRDEVGELTEAFNLLMSEQQAAAAHLRASEARYRTVISSLAEGVIVTDREDGITGGNASAERILGQNLEEMRGLRLSDLKWRPVGSNGLPLTHEALYKLHSLADDHSAADRLLGIQPPGKPIAWYALRVQPMRDESGAGTDGLVITFSDITQLRQAEELRSAKDAAEQASHSKSAFLARMSHELRTPLNAILGFAQLLEYDPAVKETPGILRKIETIRASGKLLLAMVDEILDLSQIESGAASLSMESLDVNAALNECLRMIRPQAEKRRLTIGFHGDDIAHHVLADRTRLMQVAINLLENAIKYNRDDGQIEIRTRRDEESVYIAIGDTGIGMSAQQLEDLFQPFNRLGMEKIVGGADGAGLGLVISKQLIEAMDGRLIVESVPGAGSTFTMVFPRGDN